MSKAVTCTPLSNSVISTHWPDDETIESVLVDCHGVIGLTAARLLIDHEELTRHIAKSNHLTGVYKRETRAPVDEVEYHLRHGVKSGFLPAIGMYLQKRERELDRRSAAIGAVGDQPIDFTREVSGPDECTDAELYEIIKREILKHPAAGEPCPCCGHRSDPPCEEQAAPDDQMATR